MDWSKTKNILIVALVFMNVLLVYNIYFANDLENSVAQDFSVVEDLMNERNIDISRIEYQAYDQMPIFSVSKSKYNLSMLSSLEDDGFTITEEEDVLIIQRDIGKISNDEIQQFVDKIFVIAEIGLDQRKLIYDETVENTRYVLYNQSSDGYVFDDGFIEFDIQNGESLRCRYQWLNVEKLEKIFSGEVYPVEKSILSLIDLQEDASVPLEILNFEIVYHVDEQENLIIDNLEKSEPRPYWKTITGSGDIYYYSGLR
jgi:regulatory protein YycI of two-component signal transduction system YycFG